MKPGPFRYDPLDDPIALREATPAMVAGIYERHGPALARTIGRILLDREATLDCLQDVFADLPVRLRELPGDAVLATWLQRLALVATLAELRRRRRRRSLRRTLRSWLGRWWPAPRERRELLSVRDAEAAELEAALRAEGPLERALLVLITLERYSDAAAADLLGVSLPKARSLHRRARARIVQRLAALAADHDALGFALRGVRAFPPPPLWELLARGRRPQPRRAPRLLVALALACVASVGMFWLVHGVMRLLLPIAYVQLGVDDRFDRTGLPFTGTVASPHATFDFVQARFHVHVLQDEHGARTHVRLLSGAGAMRGQPPVELPLGRPFETGPDTDRVRGVK
jgi:RNA polymerase sigma factor (sigma-70 family)